jgi:hypothetical protein
MTALRNYDTTKKVKYDDIPNFKSKDKDQDQDQQVVPKALQTINLVEIGPGTGTMMCDILRTLNQFTGNLKNV